MNHKNILLFYALVFSSIFSFIPNLSFAKETTVQQRINELEQNQKVLERKLELEQEKTEQKEKDKAKEGLNAVFNGKEGFYLKNNDGSNAIRFKGLLQTDGRFFLGDEGNKLSNQFIARRIRPIVEGDIGKYFSFRFTPDFGGGNTIIQDAYADIKPLKELKIRIGKFKSPVALERSQSGSNLFSVERGLPSNLVGNRDLGIQLFGDVDVFDGSLSYAVGLFNGAIDGGSVDNDVSDGKDVAARLFAQPFKNTNWYALQKLGLGVGASFGSQFGSATSTQLASQRSIGQNTFFSYRSDATAPNTVIADGKRWRLSPQVYYYVGPFGIFGELVLSSQKVNLAGSEESILNRAWQIASSYIITGEENSFGGFKVKNPVNFKKGNWGALEIGARYNELDIDNNAFPVFANPNSAATRARSFGTALNWHLTNNYKFTVSYDFTKFKGGAAAGANKDAEHALFTRLQVAY